MASLPIKEISTSSKTSQTEAIVHGMQIPGCTALENEMNQQ